MIYYDVKVLYVNISIIDIISNCNLPIDTRNGVPWTYYISIIDRQDIIKSQIIAQLYNTCNILYESITNTVCCIFTCKRDQIPIIETKYTYRIVDFDVALFDKKSYFLYNRKNDKYEFMTSIKHPIDRYMSLLMPKFHDKSYFDDTNYIPTDFMGYFDSNGCIYLYADMNRDKATRYNIDEIVKLSKQYMYQILYI